MTPPEADLHPDLVALLADPRLALTRPPPGVSLEAFRQAANGYLARAPRPELEKFEDVTIDGPGGSLALRLYHPPSPSREGVVLFLHGGGFVFGNLETHDALCRSVAIRSGMTVVAVDYRLAPEHPYPAGLQDALAALAWVRASLSPKAVAIAGDSAGAQIATAAALTSDRHDAPVQALGLLYPCVDPIRETASQRRFETGHMLTGDFLDWAWSAYAGGQDRSADLMFDLSLADLSALPSAILVTAGHDPLRDEGLALGRRIHEAGVDLSSRHYPDMIHGFLGLPRGSARGEAALSFLADGLRRVLASA